MSSIKIVIICVAISFAINVTAMNIQLSCNGKAVQGSNVTFTAIVSEYTGQNLQFHFHDDAIPQHKYLYSGSTNTTTWTVEYPKSLYEKGNYKVYVKLYKWFVSFWVPEGTATTTFELTETLNGDLVLNQDNKDRKNNFVAVNKAVLHYIKLPQNELKYIQGNSSSILTHWFIDCIFIGTTTDMSLNYTYRDNMSDHQIEAILVADNDPLPPLTTTTTTTTSTTTTTTTTTTTSTTTTTPKPQITTTDKPQTTENAQITTNKMPTTEKSLISTDNITSINTTIVPPPNFTVVETGTSVLPAQKLETSDRMRSKRSITDYTTCNNSVLIGPNSVHGRFETKLSVRQPISTINITGRIWLQHGDLMNLDVKYPGSPPFYYCVFYKPGQYNVTGNETCSVKTRTLSNYMQLVHYFADTSDYTVVVVLENDVGKRVARSTINIYKSSVHPQLSVIVVPVVFCLVAVILVVFGIAYYQHRSRHIIEIADFDFGQANPGYLTFGVRLRNSFRNALNFRTGEDTDPLTPNSRYDSMS